MALGRGSVAKILKIHSFQKSSWLFDINEPNWVHRITLDKTAAEFTNKENQTIDKIYLQLITERKLYQ